MKTSFRESFEKDVRVIHEKNILARIKTVIEMVEAAPDTRAVAGLKKLKGAADYYRIRVGEYRIGIIVGNNEVVFVRVLQRKDIYRYFP
ncbi:MAG: type II toxin-antitoxin system RelE/ParE family toxin [Lentisphaerae bacterium]|nr:type II toxin-antitoxin system RelE/ParE family toxin [Lentisphaerota bacterium]